VRRGDNLTTDRAAVTLLHDRDFPFIYGEIMVEVLLSNLLKDTGDVVRLSLETMPPSPHPSSSRWQLRQLPP